MARKLASDKVLFGALVALSLFGCIMIYSASAVSSGETSGNPYRFLLKQIARARDRRRGGLRRLSHRLPALRPALGRLRRSTARPCCSRSSRSSSRRSTARAAGSRSGVMMLQPSELLKVALVLVVAYQLSRKSPEGGGPGDGRWCRRWSSSGAAAGVVVLAAGPRHRGLLRDALRRAAVAGGRSRALVRLRRAGDAPAARHPDALGRLPAGAAPVVPRTRGGPARQPGFQAIQSLIAVGAGGWFGNGLGGSRQKLFFLPFPHTDFIFAIVGEELGFVGAVGVVLCFGIVAWRGLRAARRAPDAFAAFWRRARRR